MHANIQKYLFYILKSHIIQDRIVELAYNKTPLIPLSNLSIHQKNNL
jgi:hypothetical protein